MKKVTDRCDDCRGATNQIQLGFIPVELINPDDNRQWINAAVCLSCESIIAKEVSKEQLRKGEKRYLYVLSEYGSLSKEEAKDILGL